jgi:hypothetical protein
MMEPVALICDLNKKDVHHGKPTQREKRGRARGGWL